jgi:hypothetical protein
LVHLQAFALRMVKAKEAGASHQKLLDEPATRTNSPLLFPIMLIGREMSNDYKGL